MKKILGIFLLTLSLTLTSCAGLAIGYDSNCGIEFYYYDSYSYAPIIYRGTTPYYIYWESDIARYRPVPMELWGRIHRYDTPHHFDRGYSFNRPPLLPHSSTRVNIGNNRPPMGQNPNRGQINKGFGNFNHNSNSMGPRNNGFNLPHSNPPSSNNHFGGHR